MTELTQDELDVAIKVINFHITIRKETVETYSRITDFDPDLVEYMESEINDLYNVHDMVATVVTQGLIPLKPDLRLV